MDKKELKLYVTPAQEIIETELENFLCASPTGGGSEDVPGDNIDPGFFG
jgi:hypothetical protein